MRVGPDKFNGLFLTIPSFLEKGARNCLVTNTLMANSAYLVQCGLPSDWFSQPIWLGQCRNSYLVDPASSHMLVSKIKPCMSKYKQIYTVKLRMAH